MEEEIGDENTRGVSFDSNNKGKIEQ